MKTAIRHILVYFILLNLAAPIVVGLVDSLCHYFATGALPDEFMLLTSPSLIVAAELTGMLFMVVYLWMCGVLRSALRSLLHQPGMAAVAGALLSWAGSYWIVSVLMSHLTWIPDIMEQAFGDILSGWVGVVTVALVGPVVEELLFRKAVTDALLKQFHPLLSIFFSAMLFGLFHINPAQIVPAFLIGLLLTWVYVRTGSLLLTTIMHILNNSLSVWLMTRQPAVDDVTQLVSGTPYYMYTALAVALLAAGVYMLITSQSAQSHRRICPPRVR
jgi:hypothetical protein